MSSRIEWTDVTWNPVRGCSRVSEGCRNCFAERMAARFCGEGQPYHGLVTESGRWSGHARFVAERLAEPMRWTRPRRVFVNSMSDLFHKSLTNEQIAAVFGVMAACPQHTFQALTKRPERAAEWFRWVASEAPRVDRFGAGEWTHVHYHALLADLDGTIHERGDDRRGSARVWPLQNVWLGVSIENQETADERIPWLLQFPAAVRWVSCEPMLGPVDLGPWLGIPRQRNWAPWVAWVVCGGETGPGARPMHPDWARSLRDQCASVGVPFLFKQWGEWMDVGPAPRRVRRVGKKAAGRLLDGVLHDAYPEAGR